MNRIRISSVDKNPEVTDQQMTKVQTQIDEVDKQLEMSIALIEKAKGEAKPETPIDFDEYDSKSILSNKEDKMIRVRDDKSE